MGKYLRSCKQQPPPSPAGVESVAAAAVSSYLMLRSGRRVPAAGGGPCGRRHRRGGCRCVKNSAMERECGAKSASASRQRRCKEVDYPQGGERASPSPSQQGNSGVVSSDISGERNFLKPNYCSGEVAEHDGEHNPVAAGRPSLSPPEAEIEAFFAAAELAERRRFAETYNYDVALDRPLKGRFEWTPVRM